MMRDGTHLAIWAQLFFAPPAGMVAEGRAGCLPLPLEVGAGAGAASCLGCSGAASAGVGEGASPQPPASALPLADESATWSAQLVGVLVLPPPPEAAAAAYPPLPLDAGAPLVEEVA